MKKVVRRTIRRKTGGIDLAADVNAVIAVNEGDGSGSAEASSSQRIVQRSRVSAQPGPRTAEGKENETKEE